MAVSLVPGFYCEDQACDRQLVNTQGSTGTGQKAPFPMAGCEPGSCPAPLGSLGRLGVWGLLWSRAQPQFNDPTQAPALLGRRQGSPGTARWRPGVEAGLCSPPNGWSWEPGRDTGDRKVWGWDWAPVVWGIPDVGSSSHRLFGGTLDISQTASLPQNTYAFAQ